MSLTISPPHTARRPGCDPDRRRGLLNSSDRDRSRRDLHKLAAVREDFLTETFEHNIKILRKHGWRVINVDAEAFEFELLIP